jgi:uncharacterized membrane protein
MTLPEVLSYFGPLDGVALALLLVGWGAIGTWIDRAPVGPRSVTLIMADYRRRWMAEMLTREPRIYDATILNGLRQGTTWFASTSILAIGGVLALVGNTDPLTGVARGLGEEGVAAVVWQLKLLLVVLLLASGFLKFVWSNRVFGYGAVVMSAVPNDPTAPGARGMALQAAELNVRAAINFNRGLRAIYFALAALTWILGPYALILASLATLGTLWHREFASHSRKVMLEPPPDHKAATRAAGSAPDG